MGLVNILVLLREKASWVGKGLQNISSNDPRCGKSLPMHLAILCKPNMLDNLAISFVPYVFGLGRSTKISNEICLALKIRKGESSLREDLQNRNV